jgi:hypothetical protein
MGLVHNGSDLFVHDGKLVDIPDTMEVEIYGNPSSSRNGVWEVTKQPPVFLCSTRFDGCEYIITLPLTSPSGTRRIGFQLEFVGDEGCCAKITGFDHSVTTFGTISGGYFENDNDDTHCFDFDGFPIVLTYGEGPSICNPSNPRVVDLGTMEIRCVS